MSKDIFSNITSEEYYTLCKILNSTPATFFFDNPTIDGRVPELERAKFISVKNGN